MPDLSNERIFPANIRVKVVFESDAKWRLVEDFGPECFVEQEDGRLLFQMDYTDEESLVGWLLTFGQGQRFWSRNNKGEIAENSGRSYICLPKRRRKETGEVGHTGMPA